MRRIKVSEFITLDGVVETPEEWWFPYDADDVGVAIRDGILNCDTFLYGRGTYDIFSQYWPAQTEDTLGFESHLNKSPKYVVSTSLKEATWNNTTLISKDFEKEVAALKQSGSGVIGMTGSLKLVRALAAAGLVDEYDLLLTPIVMGRGRRLFEDGAAMSKLKLVNSHVFSTGVIGLTYQVADQ